LIFFALGCIVQKEVLDPFTLSHKTVAGGRMTPVSSLSSLETEESASPFFQLLQQIPLECYEKERFMESEILGVQIYPEKGFLVLRLKMQTPVTAACYANVSGYLKENLPGVNRIVLDVHYPLRLLRSSGLPDCPRKGFHFLPDGRSGYRRRLVFPLSSSKLNGSELVLQVPHELARQQLERRHCEKFILTKF
jgi:hypothetical protein